MELNIKKIYDINCDWFAHGNDASGKSKNRWNGEIVVLGDNSCFGYATDNGHQSPTHLLVGLFVDGSGLSICKIHGTKDEYDPIVFDAFANKNGNKNTYYGEFLAKTFFTYVPMGITSVELTEKSFQRTDVERISSVYNNMNQSVKNTPSISSVTLKEYDELDYNDMSTKIQIVANSEYNNDLPDILLNKNASQPGSGEK